MPDLRDQLRADLTSAMKARDELRRDTLRLVTAALKNADIEKGDPLDEAGLRIIDTRMQSLERVGNLPGGTGFPLDDQPTSTRGFMTAEELIRGGLFAESDSAEPGDDDER